MKKIEELAAKTGLDGAKTGRLFGFGGLGLLAAAIGALAGCAGLQQKPKQPTLEEQVLQRYGGGQAAPADAPGQAGDQKPAQNCGPYPGYPCGTRYFTVSVRDFFRRVLA